MRACITFLLVGLLALPGCLANEQRQVSSSGAAPATMPDGDRGPASKTMELRIDDVLRAKVVATLAKPQSATIRLTLKGVTPPEDLQDWLGFSIFINKPDASSATPTDDPHHVGALAFQSGNGVGPQNFSLDAGSILAGLKKTEGLDLSKPLKFTLVLIPMDNAKPTKFGAISAESLQLEVGHGKK